MAVSLKCSPSAADDFHMDQSSTETVYPRASWDQFLSSTHLQYYSFPIEGVDETSALSSIPSTTTGANFIDSASVYGSSYDLNPSQRSGLSSSDTSGRLNCKRRSWQEALSSTAPGKQSSMHPDSSVRGEEASSEDHILKSQYLQATTAPISFSLLPSTLSEQRKFQSETLVGGESGVFEYPLHDIPKKFQSCLQPLSRDLLLETRSKGENHSCAFTLNDLVFMQEMPSAEGYIAHGMPYCSSQTPGFQVGSDESMNTASLKWPDFAHDQSPENRAWQSMNISSSGASGLKPLQAEHLYNLMTKTETCSLQSWTGGLESTVQELGSIGNNVDHAVRIKDGSNMVLDKDWYVGSTITFGQMPCKSIVVDNLVEESQSRKRPRDNKRAQSIDPSSKRYHMECTDHNVSSSKQSSSWTSLSGNTSPTKSDGCPSRNGRSSSSSRHPRGPALNTNLKPRARQGSANDPQSIAARHRRERINTRLKTLQELVPNGSKVDLVTMLEKAINYVKFLQLQMKVLTNDDLWPNQQKADQADPNSDAMDKEDKVGSTPEIAQLLSMSQSFSLP